MCTLLLQKPGKFCVAGPATLGTNTVPDESTTVQYLDTSSDLDAVLSLSSAGDNTGIVISLSCRISFIHQSFILLFLLLFLVVNLLRRGRN